MECVSEGTNGGTNKITTVDKTDAELFNILLGLKEGNSSSEEESNRHGFVRLWQVL
jgi:hypothetical protein